MSRERQLNSLIDIAIKDRDNAAVILGRLQAALQRDEQQLQLLKQYHQDYCRRRASLENTRYQSNELQNYQRFLMSLTEAIMQQQNKITNNTIQVEQAREDWSGHARYVEQIEKLQLSCASKLAKLKNKREQKAADEHTALIFHRRSTQECKKDLIGENDEH